MQKNSIDVLSLVYSDPTNSPFVYRKLSTDTEFMVDESGYVKIEHYEDLRGQNFGYLQPLYIAHQEVYARHRT